MKRKIIVFIAGLFTGAILTGGGAAYAAGIMAEYAPQRAYVDGSPVQMEAYNINGYNYVKLRDIRQTVGFNVFWDGSSIQIDSDAPYTGEAPGKPEPTPPASVPDYSAQADPAIFNGEMTREVYNAARDSVVHRDEIVAGTYTPVKIEAAPDRRERLDSIVCKLGNYPIFDVKAPEAGKLAIAARYASTYDNAVTHTESFINGLSGLSQREQVKEITWYVADRLTYSTAITSPTKILASDSVSSGNCMSYAHSFIFLCNRANIPCVLVSSKVHQWNMVYVDGQWWCVDVSSNDAGDDVVSRAKWNILNPTFNNYGDDFIDQDPNATRFAQELLVPGSTR